MPKTQFSKGQLIQLHNILRKEKMLLCEKITVFTDTYNSDKVIYNIMHFVKGKKQLKIGFITRTYPNTDKLTQQLYEYFGEVQDVREEENA